MDADDAATGAEAGVVARLLADRRGLSLEDVTAATDVNADRFFKLPPRV